MASGGSLTCKQAEGRNVWSMGRGRGEQGLGWSAGKRVDK